MFLGEIKLTFFDPLILFSFGFSDWFFNGGNFLFNFQGKIEPREVPRRQIEISFWQQTQQEPQSFPLSDERWQVPWQERRLEWNTLWDARFILKLILFTFWLLSLITHEIFFSSPDVFHNYVFFSFFFLPISK